MLPACFVVLLTFRLIPAVKQHTHKRYAQKSAYKGSDDYSNQHIFPPVLFLTFIITLLCDNNNGDCVKTVYVDVLITVNIFTDFFLLLCVKKFLNIRAKLLRVILGSFIGGILSLTALLPEIPFGLNILIDILFAAVIVFFAFGKTEIKNYIKRVAVYFGVSFFFCGIMIFIYTAFKPKGMAIYNDVVYFDISPVLLIILTLICYYILKLFKRLTKGDISKAVCDVTVENNGIKAEFKAVADTGCTVKEPFSSDYVIITEKALLNNLTFDNSKLRLIPFDSLGGNGILKGFKPGSVTVNGKDIKNVYIGVCENVIKSEIKAIVPYELVKNCEVI